MKKMILACAVAALVSSTAFAAGVVGSTSFSSGSAASGAISTGNGFALSKSMNVTENTSGASVVTQSGRKGAAVETSTYNVSNSQSIVNSVRFGQANGIATAGGNSQGSASAVGWAVPSSRRH